MFDKIEDRIIFSKKELYKQKKKELEKKKKELENEIIEIESNCPHNLTLAYFESATYPSSIKQANCLVCGAYLELENNFELFSEEEINEDNIIDITDKVSLYSQKLYRENTNVLVLKAKEILKNIMYDSYNRSLSEIKDLITNELIEYDKELTGKRLVKKL